MRDQDAGMLRFWGLSFLFFGLVVRVLAFAMDGSELSYAVGLAGIGAITSIAGSVMTVLSFTLRGDGSSES